MDELRKLADDWDRIRALMIEYLRVRLQKKGG